MPTQKTHRERRTPGIPARFLADYMDAGHRRGRTILQAAKYQPIGRVIQHDEARDANSEFMLSPGEGTAILRDKAQRLRERIADSDFDRSLYDHNAEYIDRFAEIYPLLRFPEAIRSAPQQMSMALSVIQVSIDVSCMLAHRTRSNKIRIGGVMLRYRKNQALKPEIGFWQSALLHGYLARHRSESNRSSENKLCLTLDVVKGAFYAAPGNAVTRFKEMEAACASIADQWDKIRPPTGAVL